MVERTSPTCPPPWQFTTWLDLFDHWHPADIDAQWTYMWVPNDRNLYRLDRLGRCDRRNTRLAAAWWTVRATRFTAKDQIVAARDEADKQIAAA
jgi:hypothetical protein